MNEGYGLRREWVLTLDCHKCGTTGVYKAEFQEQAFRWARMVGWRVGKQCLCPACNPKPAPPPADFAE